MLPLSLGDGRRPLELLCLGAHSDDLEIGCSGTVMRLLDEVPVERVTWVVLSGTGARAAEAREGARRVLGDRPGVRVVQAEFRDGFLPTVHAEVKDVFERLKGEVSPDLVLTHNRHDLHQDHRLVSELTYNTFRDHLILEYEIFKIDGDLGNPNLYVPLEPELVERKLELLQASFPSQHGRRWFEDDVFRSLLRLRGVEAGCGYAEAFYARKLVM